MRILVIRFSSLGDLVTLKPRFRAIRFFYPEAEITLLSSRLGKDLYQNSNYFDKYIEHESISSTVRKIKDKYNLTLNLQCNKPSHIIVKFIRSGKVINISASLIQKFLNIKSSRTTWESFFIEAGVKTGLVDLYFSNTENLNIKLPLREKYKPIFDSSRKTIGISTGSSQRWESKRWGLNNFLALIAYFLKKGFRIVLIGGADEISDAEVICNKFPEVHNYVGKTSISELRDLIACFDVFVGNDSGPAHIAGGVGVNSVTIFGSTSVRSCVGHLPYSGKHVCIKQSEKIKCHPCFLSKCPTNHECMSDISVESVRLAIDDLLEK